MPPKVYIACLDKIAAQMPDFFNTMRTAVTEENPVNYRQPHDQLLHQMGLHMAAALLSPEQVTRLTVSRGKYGKPYFKEFPHFQFNISHSGKFVACAVSRHPVGVDLQEQTVLDRNSWHLFMTHREAEACSNSDQALLLWSAKEAVSKYTGYGFMKPLPDLGMLVSQNPNTLYIGREKLFLWQQRYKIQYVLSICTCTDKPPQIEEFSMKSYRN